MKILPVVAEEILIQDILTKMVKYYLLVVT